MQTTQVYAIERVYEDLRPQFVAKDVIKQLSQLDAVVGDIFNRLAHKVGLEKDRVAAIDRRICVCQAKVNMLTERRTSNKPTTVFSTSKYPAPKGTSAQTICLSLLLSVVPHTNARNVPLASAGADQNALPRQAVRRWSDPRARRRRRHALPPSSTSLFLLFVHYLFAAVAAL